MKKEPWRVLVFVISLIFIVAIWIRKDIGDTLISLGENAIPVLVTTLGVSVIKVLLLACLILLVKWIVSKFGGKR